MNIVRVQSFLYDLESAFKARDEQFKMIRMIQIDTDIVSRSALPQHEKERDTRLAENKEAMLQADESFRVAERLILSISGKTSLEEANHLMLLASRAYSRFLEAQLEDADSEVLVNIASPEDEEFVGRVQTKASFAKRDLDSVAAYLDKLIPTDYKAF